MVAAVLTRIFHAAAPNLMKDGDSIIRERPLMTSDFRVGRGMEIPLVEGRGIVEGSKTTLKIGRYRLKTVGHGKEVGGSKIIGRHLWTVIRLLL